MHDNLERLEKLTDQLPVLEDLVNPQNGYVEYEVEGGMCHGFPLMNDPMISVQKAVITEGSLFYTHVHESREWLVVYQGELEVTVGCVRKKIGVGESIVIKPGEAHSVRALKNAKLVGITIPRDTGYPDDK